MRMRIGLKSSYEKYSKEQMAEAEATTSISSLKDCTSAAAATPARRAQKDGDFYVFLKTGRVQKSPKSELEVYLEELIYLVEDEGPFDVLKWWSQNYNKYPILSWHVMCFAFQ